MTPPFARSGALSAGGAEHFEQDVLNDLWKLPEAGAILTEDLWTRSQIDA